jgi:H+/Cl- antiporter ClcA
MLRAVWRIYWPDFSSNFDIMKVTSQFSSTYSCICRTDLAISAQKRKLLAAAAAAGVSVAFGSPLGGVLFGLEGQLAQLYISNRDFDTSNCCMFKELDTFSNESDVIWRGFVTSVIAAMALQYIDPFGTAKLVLFQVTSISDKWRAFELVSAVFLGYSNGFDMYIFHRYLGCYLLWLG